MRKPLDLAREITNAVVDWHLQPTVDFYDPDELGDALKRMRKIAETVDALFETMAAECGIRNAFAAHVCTGGLEADLDHAMQACIERAEQERAMRDRFDPQRAWGTINHVQTGVQR